MRFALILFSVLIAAGGQVQAQPPEVLWSTYFDSPNQYLINDLRLTSDQYTVGCGGVAYDDYATDLLLFLMDSTGNVVWSHTWSRLGYAIRAFDMGADGFLVAGRFSLDTSAWFWGGDETVFGLLRTDANGDSLWTRVYGGLRNRDILSDALMLPDGGCFLTGSHEHLQSPFDYARPFCVRLNANFDTLWTLAYEYDYAGTFPVHAAGSSDFVTSFMSLPSVRPTVASISIDGDSLWTRTFPWPIPDEVPQLLQVLVREREDGYTISGTWLRNATKEIYLAELDDSGDTLLVQSFSFSQDSTAEFTPVDFKGLSDGGSVVLGYIARGANPNWVYESLIVRVNAEAETLWTFRSNMPPYAIPSPTCVILTDDHGYLFTRPLFMQWHDIWTTEIVRLGPDPALTAAAITSAIPQQLFLSAHPNPFNSVSTITFSLPTAGNVELKIFNVTGRQVRTLHEGMLSAGEHKLAFEAGELPSGIYFAQLSNATRFITQKLLLIK